MTQAIVPIELQGVAALPAQTSRLAVALQAGAGLHESRFGFSAGAGLRYGATAPDRTYAILAGLNGVFHGSGSSGYVTVELELVLVW